MRGVAALLAGALRTSIGVIPGMRLLDRSRASCSASSPESSSAGRSAPFCSTCRARRICAGPCSGRRSSREINDVFPPERLLEELERVDPIGVFPRAACDRRSARQGPGEGSGRRSSLEERRARDGHRVRTRRRGLGLGRVSRTGRDERARRRGHPTAACRDLRWHGLHVDRRRVRREERPGRAPRTRAGCPPLALASPERGAAVALVGYPLNGPLTRTAARLGGTSDVLSRDAYGRGPVTRQITAIRGAVEPGSSGGPGVDAQGGVRTTVFARRPRETGGYGIPADLVRKTLAQASSRPVAATDCTS